MEQAGIDLLFKSLVILPEDKAIVTTSKTASKDLENSPSSKEDTETKTIVEEPKASYEKKPFAIFISQHLKDEYLKPESNFLKTIAALKTPQLAQHLSTERISNETHQRYHCIWTIGLDIESEKELISTNHPNLLCSPDLDQLKSNEEKKAMFLPLKKFIGANMELVSKL